MDKLTLAHEYAKVLLTQNTTRNVGEVVDCSFALAEAMLAEEEKRRDKSRPDVIEKVDNRDWIEELEFHVDWSQAPHDAKYYAIDKNIQAYWYKTKPRISGSFDEEWIGGGYDEDMKAPSFNSQGDWKDSLRERP